jgi:hypothetical protein
MSWDWLTGLFGEEKPQIGLEQKARFGKTKEYKDRFLKAIHRARIHSKNDLLKFSYLIGSYVGKEIDLTDTSKTESSSRRGKLLLLIEHLDKDLISKLENEKAKLEKGSPEYIAFHQSNHADVETGLRYISSLANQGIAISESDEIDPLRTAIVRPIVKYEYKINGRNLFGKPNRKKLYDDFYFEDKTLQKIAKKEIRRVYTPRYIGYAGITFAFVLIATTIYKNKKNKKK